MKTILVGRDLRKKIIAGLTINNKEKVAYLWKLKNCDSNRKVLINKKISKSKKYKSFCEYLENYIQGNLIPLLFIRSLSSLHSTDEFILKIDLNNHVIFDILREITYLDPSIYKENKETILDFLDTLFNIPITNKVEFIKVVGDNILHFSEKIQYNFENEEINRLINLLIRESKNTQTLVSLQNVSCGMLELHNSIEVPRKRDHQQDKLQFIPKTDISELNNFNGGVKRDEHGVGYHFHYCEKTKGKRFEVTRYLLSYNSEKGEHLKKLPNLFWEEHRENNVKSNYRLSDKIDFRRAVYHRCNSERRKLFKGLNKSDIEQLKFRNKSKEAEIFYNPSNNEKQSNKDYTKVIQ